MGGYGSVKGRSRRPSATLVVFTSDGVPEAEIRLTALWPGYLPGNTELLAVSRSRIAVLKKNTLDEEFVEVWKLTGH